MLRGQPAIIAWREEPCFQDNGRNLKLVAQLILLSLPQLVQVLHVRLLWGLASSTLQISLCICVCVLVNAMRVYVINILILVRVCSLGWQAVWQKYARAYCLTNVRRVTTTTATVERNRMSKEVEDRGKEIGGTWAGQRCRLWLLLPLPLPLPVSVTAHPCACVCLCACVLVCKRNER